MTDSAPGRTWALLRPLDMLASLWAATIPPVSVGAAAAYQTLFMTLRRLIVGRRLSVRLDDGQIALTVTEFDSLLDVGALAVGQFNEVRIAAADLNWDGRHFDRATAVLHNVHLRPGVPPVIVAAPVELTVEFATSSLDALFGSTAPRLIGEIGADEVPRLRWSRRPGLGSVEVDARLDGSTVWLRPRGVCIRRRRWRLPARMPAYPVRLPDLPHGLRLTGVGFGPGVVQVTGILPEWRIDVPRAGLEDIIAQLSSVGRTLNLTRLSRW